MEEESIANLTECLIVEILKVSNLEHKKVEEHKDPLFDAIKIAKWDKASRAANERKAGLKNRIDQRLQESIESGKYLFTPIVRDF